MTVRAVVFDIGGVLESETDYGVIGKWEAVLGLDAGELDGRLGHVWAAGSLGQITLSEVHQRIRDVLDIDDGMVHTLMEDIWTQYLGTLNGELYDYFRGLRPRYITAMLSNSFVGAREREHAAYGYADACDLIVYSHEVGMSKPDERIYHLTCGKLGVRPEETIFVDDRDANIEAAQALGFKTVLFHDNAQAIAQIANHLGV